MQKVAVLAISDMLTSDSAKVLQSALYLLRGTLVDPTSTLHILRNASIILHSTIPPHLARIFSTETQKRQEAPVLHLATLAAEVLSLLLDSNIEGK